MPKVCLSVPLYYIEDIHPSGNRGADMCLLVPTYKIFLSVHSIPMPQEGGQVRVTVAIRTTLPASTVTFSDQPGCSYNKRDALPTGVFIRGYRENEAGQRVKPTRRQYHHPLSKEKPNRHEMILFLQESGLHIKSVF